MLIRERSRAHQSLKQGEHMFRYFIHRTAAIIVAVIVLGLAISCCDDDNPVKPAPAPAKDYTVYFYDAIHNEGNWYFTYHPTSNSIDSVWLPYESYPVISADGEKMYIWNQVDDMIDVLELDSFTLIDRLPYRAPLSVSPDNQLMAVRDQEDGLHILRTSDCSEVFHDTTALGGGVFSSNSQRFYGSTRQGEAYRSDLSDSSFSVTKKSFYGALVRGVVPTLDETKWLLYLKLGENFFLFAVYDTYTDSLVFTQTIQPGYGHLRLSPDGRYAFYTNPGDGFVSEGPPWITIYDVRKNEIHKRISTAGLLDEPYQYGMPLDQICVTPDGRWLVALPVMSFPFVFTVDLHTMTITKYLRLGHWLVRGLACQNAP